MDFIGDQIGLFDTEKSVDSEMCLFRILAENGLLHCIDNVWGRFLKQRIDNTTAHFNTKQIH